jgi:hypothetical protein
MITTDKQAKEIMISLGRAGKMPCPTYNTPAKLCKTGSKLRKVKGSTCHGCYAMKGNYLFPMVQKGLQKRFEAFLHPRFVEAMTFMIKRHSKKSGYFRWFDSGDLADISMLEKIVMICQATPTIKHWLPTREVKVVSDYLKIYKEFPDYTSTVHHKEKAKGHDCPSRFQDNECRDCRACWNKEVKNVSYHKH